MGSVSDNFFTLDDGNQLYYEYSATFPNRRTVVFLNGLSQSTLAWAAVAPVIGKEMNVLLVDLVFQGRSSANGEFRSYNQHAKDIVQLLMHLKIDQPIVCGLSYGSAVAQHALVQYPDFFCGGLLLSTFAHNTAVFNAIGESWTAALLAGGYPLMLEVMLPVVLGASYFEKPLIPIQTLKESRVTANPPSENLLRLMKATELRGDYRGRLPEIKVPVTIVQGRDDVLIPIDVAEHVANTIPKGKLIVLDNAGHTLNLEAIPQLNQIIKEFCASID